MKGLKIGIVVVCLLLAGYFALSRDTVSADEIPDTEESAQPWMCKPCKNVFNLTARQYHEVVKDYGGIDKCPFGPLPCAKCGAMDSWRVALCPLHKSHYFVADVPGSRGVCPECVPEPTVVESADDSKPKKEIVPLF